MLDELSDNEAALAALENDFLRGNLSLLKTRACPVCKTAGCLTYAVAKQPPLPGPPGRRIKAGISICCTGPCNYMISLLDGFCPQWAEEIEDWEAFSQEMNSPLGKH